MSDNDGIILYIVRHAEAGQRDVVVYPDDSLRPLSKDGRKRFRCAVKKLVKRGFAPTAIATSPFVRCRQTAEVLVEKVPGEPCLAELRELEPGSQLDPLLKWSAEQTAQQIAWVGHAPDVDFLAAQLIGAKPEAIRF